MTLSESRVSQLLDNVRGRRIAVIGDVMLDRYYRGTVSRISPEAPVPIVEIAEESEYPGGAANVAYNLVMLGATPLLLGVVGNDGPGRQLRDLLNRLGISDEALLTDPSRPTTVKTRVIASSQHIVRVDREEKGEIAATAREQLLSRLEENIRTIDALILQDYNKGVVTHGLIPHVVELARTHGVPVYVDPKFNNFFEYTHVTVFKPNRKEAEDALQRRLRSAEEREEGVQELMRRLGCEYVILTLGSEGMMLAHRDESPILVPTKAIQVADVSGAGDTVIATLATACAAGASMQEAVVIANHAAGIVCEQVGTVPVRHDQLLEALLDDYRKNVESEP
ncbi:MAG: D-glycero-beta-D-manno-heptose-7-phosphate kinase [Bacteroidetes bacterium]|nr:D-glycero-beta-D-manno-heptose-7-phosphate kinase [Bacteroidota bacterium]